MQAVGRREEERGEHRKGVKRQEGAGRKGRKPGRRVGEKERGCVCVCGGGRERRGRGRKLAHRAGT